MHIIRGKREIENFEKHPTAKRSFTKRPVPFDNAFASDIFETVALRGGKYVVRRANTHDYCAERG
jgi:hypothetical protein